MVRKLIVAALAVVVLAATPASAQYPDLVVTPYRVVVGATVTVSGKQYDFNATITIVMRRIPLGGQASAAPTGGAGGDGFARSAGGASVATPNLVRDEFDAGMVVATITSDAEGAFSTTFVVPTPATPGLYEIVASSPNVQLSGEIEVVEASSIDQDNNFGSGTGIDNNTSGTGSSGDLPSTGSNLNGVGLVGAGLLVVGGLVLLFTRKRQVAAAA